MYKNVRTKKFHYKITKNYGEQRFRGKLDINRNNLEFLFRKRQRGIESFQPREKNWTTQFKPIIEKNVKYNLRPMPLNEEIIQYLLKL